MRITWLMAVVVLVVGCNAAVGGGADGPVPDLPGCNQAQEFAFIGETSLGALGLGQGGGFDNARVGRIWVTADAVPVDFGGPAPPGMPVQEPGRMVCVLWPDGGGMSGPVEGDWQPPAAAVDAAADAPPLIAPLVIAVVLIVVIGISVLAFRSERPASP